MTTELFNCVIVDLIQIGSIYQYLAQNWHCGDFSIVLQRTLNGKDFRQIIVDSPEKVDEVYHYILERWKMGKLKVRIVEQEKALATL